MSSERPSRWPLTGAALASCAYLAQIVVGDDTLPPVASWGIAATGTLSVALTAWLARRAERGALAEAARVRLDLCDAVHPVVDQLRRVVAAADQDDRTRAGGQLVQGVLAALTRRTGGERVRATWFELTGTAPRRLRVAAHHGRALSPALVFDEDDTAGRYAFTRVVDRTGVVFVPDMSAEHVGGWSHGCGFRTYLACAVRADDRVFGMLAVDAPAVGDLGADDAPFLHMMATVLATALATAPR